MAKRAVPPAQAPPPFAEPAILTARRVRGTVLAPAASGSSSSAADSEAAAVPQTPKFDRRASTQLEGNVLLIETPNGGTGETQKAFMLARKIKNTVFGTVRLGYLLQHPKDLGEGLWQVVDSAGIYAHEMVAVEIEDKARVLQSGNSSMEKNAKRELAALQLIAALNDSAALHVASSNLIAADENYIYTITRYHGEGTLDEFCAAEGGRLAEANARFFFNQILEGLSTLQSVNICHRDLSLENVRLRGTTCTLFDLANALRIPHDAGSSQLFLIEPQPPCASKPHYVAPELLQNEPFDGFAVDLWASGVMLLCMLLGNECLFVAPVLEDARFKEICIDANLKGLVDRLSKEEEADAEKKSEGKTIPPLSGLSAEAIDLLQKMLKADPKQRLTLSGVKAHEWVKGATENDSAPPTLIPNKSLGQPAAM